MAQTTLTAPEKVHVYPDHKGALQLQLTTPSQIAGWQVTLVLPEGISVEPTSNDLAIGELQENETYPKADFMDVQLSKRHANHVVIGGTDKDGGTLLVCLPTVKEGAISGTEGDLCYVNLKCGNLEVMKSADEAKDCMIKAFVASDPQGSKDTFTSVEIPFKLTVNPVGDVNGDFKVSLLDVSAVIAAKAQGSKVLTYDVSNDGKISLLDVAATISAKANWK